jgi:hypothetical protein
MTAFAHLLRKDRERWGLSIAQAAGRFGVRSSEYRELEAAYPRNVSTASSSSLRSQNSEILPSRK